MEIHSNNSKLLPIAPLAGSLPAHKSFMKCKPFEQGKSILLVVLMKDGEDILFPVSSQPSKLIFGCYLIEQPHSCCAFGVLCLGASTAAPEASCSPGQVPTASCVTDTSQPYATRLSQ